MFTLHCVERVHACTLTSSAHTSAQFTIVLSSDLYSSQPSSRDEQFRGTHCIAQRSAHCMHVDVVDTCMHAARVNAQCAIVWSRSFWIKTTSGSGLGGLDPDWVNAHSVWTGLNSCFCCGRISTSYTLILQTYRKFEVLHTDLSKIGQCCFLFKTICRLVHHGSFYSFGAFWSQPLAAMAEEIT